jgi:hypothetical protein
MPFKAYVSYLLLQFYNIYTLHFLFLPYLHFLLNMSIATQSSMLLSIHLHFHCLTSCHLFGSYFILQVFYIIDLLCVKFLLLNSLYHISPYQSPTSLINIIFIHLGLHSYLFFFFHHSESVFGFFFVDFYPAIKFMWCLFT